MPVSAQALYQQLNAECDDMGVVEIENLMRIYGACAQDDIKILEAKKYITLFEIPETWLAYINDFVLNNPKMNAKWLKESSYSKELLIAIPNALILARVFKGYVTDRHNIKKPSFQTIPMTISEYYRCETLEKKWIENQNQKLIGNKS